MQIENPVWQSSRQIKKIVRSLKGKVRFVGGCVRDSLLGKTPDDIDMATQFKPSAVVGILKTRGFEVIPTGFLYGTVTVLTGDEHFPSVEITSLRRDIQNDGRHSKVFYTQDWEQDALRRDFTFNALYADFDGTVYDYCGGIEDLKNGCVRFIGNAAERIREDFLRILRYFRFLALFPDCVPDPETLNACQAESPNLSKLSLERTRKEVFKLLQTKGAVYGLKAMAQAGLLEKYFPGADLERLNRFLKFSSQSSILMRFLALLPLTPENLPDFIERWQLSRADRKSMAYILSFSRDKNPSEYCFNDLFRFAAYFNEHNRSEILALFEAYAPEKGWIGLKEEVEKIIIPSFPFSGGDLVDLADKNKIKKYVAQVYEYWLSRNGQPDRAELLAYAVEIVKPRNPG